MKKVLVLTALIALLIVSCKTSKISLPQGTSETAQITSDEPVSTKTEIQPAEKSDDWLKTDSDFAVPDPQEPEEIAAYEEVHGETPELKAAREQRELIEKQEAERREAEQLAAKKAAEEEAARVAAAKKAEEEKAEADRIAAKKLEEEKKRALAEAERKAKAEQREADRLAARQAEEERKAKAAAARKAEAERREAERAAAKKAEEERKAREKAEAEAKRAKEKEEKAARLAQEEAERKRKADEERRREEAKKAEEERILAEAAERRAALERQAAIDAAKVTPAIEDEPYTIETLDKTPSRSVRVLVNQYLDVAYPGAGWVYLGEVDESQNLISFANRELDNSDTCFTLRAIQSGTAVLHFYKQDVLTGTYIDDFLEVVVLPQQYKGNEHQTAPLYSEIVPPNQRKYTARRNNNAQTQPDSANAMRPVISSTSNSALQEDSSYDELPLLEEEKASAESKALADKTVNRTIQIDESAPNAESKTKTEKETLSENAAALPADINNYTAAQLIEAAKKAYENKKYDESLSLLNLFFDKATSGLDEGWYLKGQLYESPNAPFRNIRTSRESYQALVDRYPSSPLWKKASNRILYIDRYYFKIR